MLDGSSAWLPWGRSRSRGARLRSRPSASNSPSSGFPTRFLAACLPPRLTATKEPHPGRFLPRSARIGKAGSVRGPDPARTWPLVALAGKSRLLRRGPHRTRRPAGRVAERRTRSRWRDHLRPRHRRGESGEHVADRVRLARCRPLSQEIPGVAHLVVVAADRQDEHPVEKRHAAAGVAGGDRAIGVEGVVAGA